MQADTAKQNYAKLISPCNITHTVAAKPKKLGNFSAMAIRFKRKTTQKEIKYRNGKKQG